jgi:hypothetical protein
LKKRTDAYSVLVGKPEGNRPIGRPGRRWEDNIKNDLKEIGWEVVYWIDLVQDRDNLPDLVNAVMNLQFT